MTNDGFPEDDDDTPPPRQQPAAYVRPVEVPPAKARRSMTRTVLWYIWFFGVIIYWFFGIFSYAARMPRQRYDVDDLCTLLILFFFFYALDRIIG